MSVGWIVGCAVVLGMVGVAVGVVFRGILVVGATIVGGSVGVGKLLGV